MGEVLQDLLFRLPELPRKIVGSHARGLQLLYDLLADGGQENLLPFRGLGLKAGLAQELSTSHASGRLHDGLSAGLTGEAGKNLRR